ncbi:MAG: transcription-repair coupling factor [Nitrospinota bacterium]|nr:MAG: transcription-repair coupling factor [Nitrospinota bacterium]
MTHPRISGSAYEKIVAAITTSLQAGEQLLSFEGLVGASKAFFLAHLFQQTGRPFCILTLNDSTCATLVQDLTFFLQDQSSNASLPGWQQRVCAFPSFPSAPYEPLSPPKNVVGRRLALLHRAHRQDVSLLVAPLTALWRRLPPLSLVQHFCWEIGVGETLDREAFLRSLVAWGYEQVEFVENVGEFSVRGGILDLFSPEMPFPLRIELFGDTVESMRWFAPENQRAVEAVEKAVCFPVRELLLVDEVWETLAASLENTSLSLPPSGEKQVREKLALLRQGTFPPGVETWSPLFYGHMATLFDYLPPDTLLILDEPSQFQVQMEEYRQTIRERYRDAGQREGWVPSPDQLFLTPEECTEYLQLFQRVEVQALSTTIPAPHLEGLQGKVLGSYQGRWETLLQRLQEWVKHGYTTVFVVRTPERARQLRRRLKEEDWGARIFPSYPQFVASPRQEALAICLGSLSTGCVFPAARCAFIEEKELFPPEKRQGKRARRPQRRDALLRYRDLQVGDFLVHVDYGIGIYRGMKTLRVRGEKAPLSRFSQSGTTAKALGENAEQEFLEIEYADGDKLYVPFDKLYLVQKYLGAGEGSPALSKLGSNQWKRMKRKVKEDIQKLAKELLELYATREMTPGFAFSPDGEWHQAFEAAFAYEETEDQYQAILDVKRDMESPKPMERLICGDVGYGKTEVAMRAAFKAVMDGKQVAVLVPTTILAHQHLATFRERFASYPITIEMLSRFRSRKEQQEILEALRLGKIDILIGTHKLLQKGVQFHDLGLLIIDEEQRFGVEHKEQLKKLRKSVDVLMLTATPIPRTLHLSLIGIRDLSVIETPPEDRLPVRTYLMRFSDQVIREAIERELARAGQVFFVHNRVESIEAMYHYLKRIVPQARIGIAHGQLPEKALERVMLQFLAREYDVLLCTAIIESGLDIPSVNTIIINRADRFGLSQLYQLRGRVGRGRIQAYAYLLIPGERLLSEVAWKRLSAMLEYSELSAGFQLALRDMEIRGAGNILGREQSGHIAAVGFDLYCKLMEETIRELRGEERREEVEPKIQLGYEGRIPSTYVPTPHQRLELYQRLYGLTELSALEELRAEIRDRYGPLPDAVHRLLSLLEVRILAKKLAIEKVEQTRSAIELVFHPTTPVSPQAILHLVQERPQQFRFVPEHTLRFTPQGQEWSEQSREVKKLLQQLLEHVSI